MGFEKALRAVKAIKDQIQYRSQSLLNLSRSYFSISSVNFAQSSSSSISVTKLSLNEQEKEN